MARTQRRPTSRPTRSRSPEIPSRGIPPLRVERVAPGGESEVLRAAGLFDEPPTLAAVKEYLADPRNLFLLALVGRQPVGFLRATELRQLHTNRRQMFLYEVSVAEGSRRRGVGRALLDRLLSHCRGADFEEVFVLTDPANVPAVRLYRSAGGVTETPADRMFVFRL
jgi:ribosomal protein S18 acetylase RimI-like enzyme